MNDNLGRTITIPYAVRGALVTATASLSTGTNTTLISGDSDYPLDIIQIGFANNSNAATTVTLSDDGTTVMVFPVAANTASFHEAFLKQQKKGGNWYVDLPDITGTTITINALLVKNS